jgi:hypothetical protein
MIQACHWAFQPRSRWINLCVWTIMSDPRHRTQEEKKSVISSTGALRWLFYVFSPWRSIAPSVPVSLLHKVVDLRQGCLEALITADSLSSWIHIHEPSPIWFLPRSWEERASGGVLLLSRSWGMDVKIPWGGHSWVSSPLYVTHREMLGHHGRGTVGQSFSFTVYRVAFLLVSAHLWILQNLFTLTTIVLVSSS